MNIETYKAIANAYHLAKEEIVDKYSWQELANLGFKVEAILKYRIHYNCRLSEAKKCVDDYIDTNKKAHVTF